MAPSKLLRPSSIINRNSTTAMDVKIKTVNRYLYDVLFTVVLIVL